MKVIRGIVYGLVATTAFAQQELPDAEIDDAFRIMVDDYFDVESDRLEIRTKYIRRFDNVLPPAKLARLVQLENQFNLVIDIQIASVVPLVR